jgi:DNA repair protein RadC
MKATATKRTITLPAAVTAPDGALLWSEADILAAAERIANHRHTQRGMNVMSDPKTTARYLLAAFRCRTSEVFACLFLDSQHRLIELRELFHGTIDGAAVYPREVVAAAMSVNAAAVIFTHNHPSGVAEPSLADRQITRRLTDALALVDIRVLDHVVVGSIGTVSFAERGLI